MTCVSGRIRQLREGGQARQQRLQVLYVILREQFELDWVLVKVVSHGTYGFFDAVLHALQRKLNLRRMAKLECENKGKNGRAL